MKILIKVIINIGLIVFINLSANSQVDTIRQVADVNLAFERDSTNSENMQELDSLRIAKQDSIKMVREMLIDSIIDYSKTFVGTKYRYGGITPAGFDCSGFMFHIHRHFSLPLPRVPSATCLMGDIIDLDSLLPGDLVYFKTRAAHDKTIGHVGMVIEKVPGSFIMIHSASHAGLVIENFVEHHYYVSRYLYANRLPDEFYLRQWNDSLMKIYRYKNADLYVESQSCSVVPATQPEGTTLLTYVVKSGDMFGLIASWYKVSVAELKAWNGLYSDRLSIGQSLKVYIKNELVSIYSNVNNMSYDDKQRLAGVSTSSNSTTATTTQAIDPNYEYYTVKSGDTPYGISLKYPGVSADDIMKLNGISNPSALRIGQSLKIRKK